MDEGRQHCVALAPGPESELSLKSDGVTGGN